MITFFISLTFLLILKMQATMNITQLKIGLRNSRIEYSEKETELFIIKTNYKHVSILLRDFVNIESIQLSDKLNTNDMTQSYFNCASNASICQNREVNPASEIAFDSKLYVNAIYLTMRTNNTNLPSSFETNIDFIYNELNEDSQYIYETPFAFCGESNLEECRSCGRPSCALIKCGYEEINDEQEEKFYTLNEVCLPYSADDNQIKDICQNFYLATTYRPSSNCDYGDSAGYSYMKMIVFGVIIVVVALGSLIVLYYHVYVRN